MIRSASHGSYPRVGTYALDQEIRTVERRLAAGRIDADEATDVLDRNAGIVVAEQARAFVDVVTDGLVRWPGFVARWAAHLDGARPGAAFRWFDTPQFDRRMVIEGEVGWPGPMTRREFEVAQDVAGARVVKAVLPGPVLAARLSDDRVYGDLKRRALALAAATAREIAALVEAGCRFVQIDEPLAARYPEDLDLVAESAAVAFEGAGPETSTSVSLHHGDVTPLVGRLGDLPGTHVGIDVCAGGDAVLAALRALPERRGLCLGLFDAGDVRVEDAADVRARIEPHRAALEGRDLVVGPNAGLEPLPRDVAFDKLQQARYLAEALREAWT